MVDKLENLNVEQTKKVWTKPELNVLDVKNTKYWSFEEDPLTGFWKNVWVDDEDLGLS